MLTERQSEVMIFIKEFIAENSYPPTRAEIGEHFEIRPNAVQEQLVKLESKGKLSIIPNIARGIVIK